VTTCTGGDDVTAWTGSGGGGGGGTASVRYTPSTVERNHQHVRARAACVSSSSSAVFLRSVRVVFRRFDHVFAHAVAGFPHRTVQKGESFFSGA